LDPFVLFVKVDPLVIAVGVVDSPPVFGLVVLRNLSREELVVEDPENTNFQANDRALERVPVVVNEES